MSIRRGGVAQRAAGDVSGEKRADLYLRFARTATGNAFAYRLAQGFGTSVCVRNLDEAREKIAAQGA